MPLHCCVHCLHRDCAELKADVKGRPYMVCRCCGSRSFLHANIALRGIRFLGPQLVSLWQAATAGQFLAQIDADIEKARIATLTPASSVG